jgi:hypothetical protein
LNLLPKLKLSISIQGTFMQKLVIFGAKEVHLLYFSKLAQMEMARLAAASGAPVLREMARLDVPLRPRQTTSQSATGSP